MYSVHTLTSIVATAVFAADRALVQTALNALRYGQSSPIANRPSATSLTLSSVFSPAPRAGPLPKDRIFVVSLEK